MLPGFNFNEVEILSFALVLIRVSAFIMSWPVFSVYSVPPQLKVLWALTISFLLFPVINRAGLTAASLNSEILWLASKEVLTGLCLGFLTRLFFFALSAGGNIIATSIGLANGQIFNPALSQQSTTVEQFYITVGTLLFLALNGHHYFLTGLAQSFDAIPLSMAGTNIAYSIGESSGIGTLVQLVVESAVKIAAPVMVAIFILNLALGILGRAVPQINVLITSMAVNIMAGLMVMIVAIPALLFELDHQLISFAELVFKYMKQG